jgi:hypothetical protein
MFAAANVDAGCMGMHHLQRFPLYFQLSFGLSARSRLRCPFLLIISPIVKSRISPARFR